MRPVFASLILGVAATSAIAQPVGDIVGKAKVIDGDTLEVGGRPVRLWGIDAPAADQTCTAGGASWPCGENAAFALAFETAEHWLACTAVPDGGEAATADRAPEATRAICKVGPYDLAARLVRQGWALADRRVSDAYVEDERAAQAAGAGLWRGGFVAPWEWAPGGTAR